MRRGLVLNILSNLVFFLSGYAMHFYLGNSLSAASYGVVGTIITVLDFEYMFLSNGARQSLSREISSGKYDTWDIIRKTSGFQLLIIAAFFSINFFGAPLFAKVLNDYTLTFYFRVSAFLIPANGLFVILLGVNDGLRRFGSSALLGTVYPIAKLLVIPMIMFVFGERPVLGVEVGFLCALLLSIAIGGIMLVGHPPRVNGTGETEILPFWTVAANTLSFSLFFIVVSVVLSVDTLVVKSVVTPPSMAGYYTGAVNFGKIAYYLLSAFVTVILPVISLLVSRGDRQGAIDKAREIVLISTAFVLPIVMVISASSGNLLSVFYGRDYSVAGQALSYLSLSNFFMGMTVILNMILSPFHKGRFSDVLSMVTLLMVFPLFIVCARIGGISYIAFASMICTALTLITSYVMVRRYTGPLLGRKSLSAVLLNVLLWIGVRILFNRFQVSNLFALAGVYAAIYIFFVALLIVLHVIRVPSRNVQLLLK